MTSSIGCVNDNPAARVRRTSEAYQAMTFLDGVAVLHWVNGLRVKGFTGYFLTKNERRLHSSELVVIPVVPLGIPNTCSKPNGA
ncbi:hypothetical protein WG66_011314 [Moniliophthora roreri]|nr:hypothetical protein WG66_011314 [Moniliophthora roreri]